jgi:hypothetical protein
MFSLDEPRYVDIAAAVRVDRAAAERPPVFRAGAGASP